MRSMVEGADGRDGCWSKLDWWLSTSPLRRLRRHLPRFAGEDEVLGHPVDGEIRQGFQ
jgi:hypothetical protein